jgi:hypothetical protein
MISAKKTKIFLTVIGNVSYIRNEYFGFFVYNSKENKYMPHWSEKFRAAFKKNVHDILQGELRNLKADEKRQLLAILREHDDCPNGWKNKKNMAPKKQRRILNNLRNAIYRLLNPDKARAIDARNNKKRRENGKAEAARKKYRDSGEQKAANDRNHKKYRESGKRKVDYDRSNAKVSQARHEANIQAILENKDHKEDTWDEDTLERLATEIVEMIVNRCGRNGFVHVFGGAWPGMTVNEAMEAECFGRGRNSHAVFIDGTNSRHKFVRYRDVSTHVELFAPYSGTNYLNADDLEKRIHEKLIDMEWPQHRRMFVCKGKGTCRGTRPKGMPFPYYTGVLICEQSMEQIGIRLATTKDHPPKRKRSSSSL